jgi:hypothetical protein
LLVGHDRKRCNFPTLPEKFEMSIPISMKNDANSSIHSQTIQPLDRRPLPPLVFLISFLIHIVLPFFLSLVVSPPCPTVRYYFHPMRSLKFDFPPWKLPSDWNLFVHVNSVITNLRDSDRNSIDRLLPFDGEGCPRSHFSDSLRDAVIYSPLSHYIPSSCLCVFLFTIHKSTYTLRRFIHRLSDPEFIFILCPDQKVTSLRRSLEIEWEDNPTVFFLGPPIAIHWGSFSQSFPPWMTVKALRDLELSYDWISFHSGTDLVIRSRTIVKLFLRTYKDHAEFFEVVPNQWPRMDHFIFAGPGCTDLIVTKKIENIVKQHYNATAWNASARNFAEGANWATISRKLAEKALDLLLNDPNLAIRLSFTSNGDELFLQTLVNRVGFGYLGSCGMIRYLKFEVMHPFPLTEKMILESRNEFALFARKMREGGNEQELHGWIEKVIDREDNETLPEILRPRVGSCYRTEIINYEKERNITR